MNDSGFGIRDSGFGIRDSGFDSIALGFSGIFCCDFCEFFIIWAAEVHAHFWTVNLTHGSSSIGVGSDETRS